jgi:NAD(P)-dependent dehydrogenase (short-subunit alcohol dehydrogenase family)
VNLTGMFLCCQAASRPMLAQGSGSIINICSTYGLVGPDQRIYERPGQPQAVQAGLLLGHQSGRAGPDALPGDLFCRHADPRNALTPGGVYNNHDELFTTNYSARTVLGRMANRDEMNGALLFLASEASSYMTGSNVVVDGGWTAW